MHTDAWSRRRDSNPQPLASEASAHPLELRRDGAPGETRTRRSPIRSRGADPVRHERVAPAAGLEPAVAFRRTVNSRLGCHSPHTGMEPDPGIEPSVYRLQGGRIASNACRAWLRGDESNVRGRAYEARSGANTLPASLILPELVVGVEPTVSRLRGGRIAVNASPARSDSGFPGRAPGGVSKLTTRRDLPAASGGDPTGSPSRPL